MPIVEPSGQAAGGGSQPGTVVPVADPTGATVDTTTYDDPYNEGQKLTTLVFPASQGYGGDTPAIAIAIEGDAYPRWIIASDATDGINMGDGTVDPSTGIQNIHAQSGGSGMVINYATAHQAVFGNTSPNYVGVLISTLDSFIQLVSGAILGSDSGDPNDNYGGNVGDYFFRTDTPSTPTQRIYVCTVAGLQGDATWVGIL